MIQSDVGTVNNTGINESCNVTVDGQEEYGNIVSTEESQVGGDTTHVTFENGEGMNLDNDTPVTISID